MTDRITATEASDLFKANAQGSNHADLWLDTDEYDETSVEVLIEDTTINYRQCTSAMNSEWCVGNWQDVANAFNALLEE